MHSSASATVSVTSLLLVALALGGQVLGAAWLPRTAGFTNPLWTALCVTAFLISIFVMAYAIKNGLSLSLLVPMISVGMPICTIAIGVFIYKEPASVMKVLTLCTACGLVGVASVIK